MGIDPDAAEERAKKFGAEIVARGARFSAWVAGCDAGGCGWVCLGVGSGLVGSKREIVHAF